MCLRIIDCRAYARAKDAVKRAEKADDLPDDPMIDIVQDIEFALAREAMERKRGAK